MAKSQTPTPDRDFDIEHDLIALAAHTELLHLATLGVASHYNKSQGEGLIRLAEDMGRHVDRLRDRYRKDSGSSQGKAADPEKPAKPAPCRGPRR